MICIFSYMFFLKKKETFLLIDIEMIASWM